MPTTPSGSSKEEEPLVLKDLHRFLSYRASGEDGDEETRPSAESSQDEDGSEILPPLFDKSAMAVPVAAMKVLLGVVERSKAGTMMQLEEELREAAELMTKSPHKATSGRSNIALRSGCELFLKYSTRTFLELPDFSECKQAILERGQRFQLISLAARDRIAAQAAAFVPNNGTVLTHGYSRVVANILLEAATSQNKHFDLIVLEGRPDAAGVKAARFYAQAGIPVKLCLDAAAAMMMEQADIVLTGAEAIAENGGVINKIGTYSLACAAAANNKPMYVAAESYKFARLFPLRQSDLPLGSATMASDEEQTVAFCDTSVKNKGASSSFAPIELDSPTIQVHDPSVDFTPAKFISLLFTDLGVLTPSAVSDELIRLYQ